MTNTDLERYVDLVSQMNTDTNAMNYKQMTESDMEEYESLKSKLESQLEKAEKYEQIEKHTTSVGYNLDDIIKENKQLKEVIELKTEAIDILIRVAQDQKQKLEKIEKETFHAGCMGNPDCVLCPIVKILKE